MLDAELSYQMNEIKLEKYSSYFFWKKLCKLMKKKSRKFIQNIPH